MHLKRVVIALIALPLLYLYISKLSLFYFLILLVLISSIAQAEFYSMYKSDRLISLAGILGGIFTLCAPFIVMNLPGLRFAVIGMHAFVFTASFMLIALIRLFKKKDPVTALRDISPAVVGILYIPNLLVTQWYLRLEGYEWILFLYGCVYAADSAAYYIGKGIGRRKLYSAVSPNKTVAGAVASVIGGIAASAVLGSLLPIHRSIFGILTMGGIIGGVTIAGDLVESMFKRDADIKDSGHFIPGHGGILDKIDSALFAGPVLYWMTLYI